MRSVLCASAVLIAMAQSPAASTVSINFGLDDLNPTPGASVRAARNADGEVSTTDAEQTRLGSIEDIEAFDEAANGTLERVDVRFDFDLPIVGFSTLDFFADLKDPNTAFAESEFRVSIEAFIFDSGSPAVVRDIVFDQTFETSTQGCIPSSSNFSCTTRDVFRATPNALGTFSLTGDELDIVRSPHQLGLLINFELLGFDSNTSAFRTGGFLNFRSFETDGASANFGIDYHTAPIPLPAGAWLLLSGLGLMWATRRRQLS